MNNKEIVNVLIFLMSCLVPVFGITQSEYIAKRSLEEEITIDGILDEKIWKKSTPLPLIMFQPTHKGEKSEETKIRICYDAKNLYVGAHMFDSKPESIRTNSLYRDQLQNDDEFGILFDVFNDKENAKRFTVNPAGVKFDELISNDGRTSNGNWNSHWQVETTENGKGWFAEIKIPFYSLSYLEMNDTTNIGIIAYRYISRKNEVHVFPDISPSWNILTPSQSEELKLTELQLEKPVFITPYIIGGMEQLPELNLSENSYEMETHIKKNVGFDLKYYLTNNILFDVTVNTDFAHIEVDDQQINLTRYSLFYPEKRQFFQEQSELFNVNMALWNHARLFHSRNIGLNNGKDVPIIAGVRSVGRFNNWEFGAMNVETGKFKDQPHENFGLLRIRKQVFNPQTRIGGIIISRVNAFGDYNYTFGLDGIFRVFEIDDITLKWAQTIDEEILKQHLNSFVNTSSFHTVWERRNDNGLYYRFGYSRIGKFFLPGSGFVARKNYSEYSWRLGYNWLMSENSIFRLIQPLQIFGFIAQRNSDRTVESAQLEYDLDFQWKNGASVWTDIECYYEDVTDTLIFFEDTNVVPDSYTFGKIEGGYNSSPGRVFRYHMGGGFGRFYNGKRLEINLTFVWHISKHINVTQQYHYDKVDFNKSHQGFDSHVLRLRVQGALNTKFSVNCYIQYNHLNDYFSSNARLRYNFREGRDLWLVYNEGINTMNSNDEFKKPGTDVRALSIKYTHTFDFKKLLNNNSL